MQIVREEGGKLYKRSADQGKKKEEEEKGVAANWSATNNVVRK